MDPVRAIIWMRETSRTMRRGLPFRNLRSYLRRNVDWPAQVTLKAGRRPIACRVKDISERGALLEFSERAPLSESFHLRIADIKFDGICRVKHRSSRTIGVEFGL